MTNQLLVCISASWDTVVNCPQNKMEQMDDLQVWKKVLLLLVGFFFFQIGWSWVRRYEIKFKSETDASTHQNPGSVKGKFQSWYYNIGHAFNSWSYNAKETVQKKSFNSPESHPASQIKQQMLQWLNKIDLGQHRNISIA